MKSYVGIDVGKRLLEIHYNEKSFSVLNTKTGIKRLLTELKKLGASCSLEDILIVFEATGGYE